MYFKKLTFRAKLSHLVVHKFPLPSSLKNRFLPCAKEGRFPFLCSFYDFFFRKPGLFNLKILKFYFVNIKHNMPFLHAPSFYDLCKFKSFNDDFNIVMLLDAGILLGAVRQGAFAGRPNDIDVVIIFDGGIDRYLKMIKFHGKKYGIREKFHLYNCNGLACLKLGMHTHIDVFVCNADTDSNVLIPENINPIENNNKKYVWRGINESTTATIYNTPFYIPNNWKNYLDKKYGKNWITPDKKQISWLSPNITKVDR